MPIVFPGMIAVALFGFTLSYDEFPRSWLTVGTKNTLPLEIWTMTTNVTSPALYALGTVTTVISFIVIAIALRLDRPHPTQTVAREMNMTANQSVRAGAAARTGSGEIRLANITKQFGNSYAVAGHQPDHSARLLLLPARPVGLRQDHDPAHDRRARDADLGRDLHRRPDGGRQAAGRARHGDDVPELCALPASDASSTMSPST